MTACTKSSVKDCGRSPTAHYTQSLRRPMKLAGGSVVCVMVEIVFLREASFGGKIFIYYHDFSSPDLKGLLQLFLMTEIFWKVPIMWKKSAIFFAP